MQELRNDGVLSDLTKIDSLLSVAKQYVITDAHWNLLDFAAQMRDLTGGNLVFHTLPIQGYETIDGQDANEINPGYIKQLVQETFYPPAVSPSSPSSKPKAVSKADASKTTVDVYNGGDTTGLAAAVSAALVKQGFKPGAIADTSALSTTGVLYGTGSAANASKIASEFGVTAAASATVAAGHVEILLGADATVPSASPTPASSSSPIPTSGAQGGAVTAKDGIPCVD
jgi:hypothetical protein